MPPSLYLLGYLEKYKITARQAGLSSVLIMIMMINKWDGWRAPSFLSVTFLPLQLHPNRQLCPCISLRHIVTPTVQLTGFAAKHYNVNWSELSFFSEAVDQYCMCIAHCTCTTMLRSSSELWIDDWWTAHRRIALRMDSEGNAEVSWFCLKFKSLLLISAPSR